MANTPILFYMKGTCALGSIIALEALNEPYQLVRLEKGDLDSDAYLGINPMGEVPTLITSDGTLTESLAILQHIGAKAIDQSFTFPQNTARFDQLNRILSYLVTSYHQSFAPLFYIRSFHPDPKIQKEIRQNVIQKNIKEQLKYIDRILLNGGLFFNHFTIADAYFYGTGRWAKALFNVESEFPNIARFFDHMNRKEVVRTALAIEEGRVNEPRGAFRGHIALNLIKSSKELLFPGLQTSFKELSEAEPIRRSGAI